MAGLNVSAPRAFKEKPPLAEAEAMLADGLHAWNSGMFVWRVARYLGEVERQMPALHQRAGALGR